MRYFYFILLCAFAWGCANDADPEADKASFTRIYDNNKFGSVIYPIDIKQTSDGGYLILGGRKLTTSNFSGIYLLKTDALGAYVEEQELDEDLVAPIGPLMLLNDGYYFFCMTSVGLQTQLIRVNLNGTIDSQVSVGNSYPAAAAQEGNNFLLLSYNNVDKQSVISVVTPAGAVQTSKAFSIGAGDAVEEPIINHFLRTGRQLPFLVGRIPGGLFYFNGFFNYTLSLSFTNLAADEPQGILQGQQDDGGISQAVPLDGGKFALARFNFGDNYFLPAATINSSGISSSVDLGGNVLPELVPNAAVKILRTTINGRQVVLYGSDTNGKQIVILGYDEATGSLVGSKYLGFSNPYELAAILPTSDGGLAVCGRTYVAGRFGRICLFKLSSQEVESAFKGF
ncbi:MAG: hypothetical protein KF775_03630 [Cyclobacteriaceae bacterium]|nr:hypothetical protein [Cyclobacteriaceae bacterium]